MDLKDSFFDTGEVQLHMLEGPESGPPLVLLHGAISNCTDWLPLIPRLAERWHVFAVDSRGHGLSGRPAGPEGYHISHNIADVVALLRDRIGEPAVLMGHSYGAVISALAGKPAAEWLRGIVLEDPPLMLRRDNVESRPYLDYFTWFWQMRQSASTVDEILAALSLQNPHAPLEAMRPWAQALAWVDPNYALAIISGNTRETVRDVDFEEHIRGIACPVLLLQADPAKGAALVQQDLDFFLAQARNARLVPFPGSGHGIHGDQPEQFLRAFDDFCASLP